MSKFAIRLLTLAMFSMALVAAPCQRPMPRATTIPRRRRDTKKAKKKSNKSSSIDDPDFVAGYRAAYTTIYDRHDYASAIEQLKALGHDDSAAVANLIGYSYRKLGDYKVSQVWYERALKADPNHVKTWQYYGLWQLEQGNRDQAQYHLSRIAAAWPAPTARNIARSPPRWRSRRAPASSTDCGKRQNSTGAADCAGFVLALTSSSPRPRLRNAWREASRE